MSELGYGNRKQSKFAEDIGVSPSFLSDVLKMKSEPSYGLLFGITKKFPNIDPSWLMTGQGTLYGTAVATIKADDPETAKLIEMTCEVIGQDSEYSKALKSNIRMSYDALKTKERYHDLEARMRQILEDATGEPYQPDRRKGQRRRENVPDAIPGKMDRRSGMDRRRVAATKP